MSVHHGKGGKVKLSTNVVSDIKNFSYDETVGTSDTTTMGDASETHLSGIKAWTAKITCNHNPDDTLGQSVLKVGDSVDVVFYTDGDGVGKATRSGTGTVDNVGVSVDMGNTVESTFSVKGNGELTSGVVS